MVALFHLFRRLDKRGLQALLLLAVIVLATFFQQAALAALRVACLAPRAMNA